MSAAPERDAPRFRRGAGVAAGVYACVLAFFLLLPTSSPASASVEQVRGWLLDAGVPPTLTVVRAQFLANVAIFVPAVALAVAAWPRLRWQDCVAYGFLASFGVEVAQALLLPDRVASTRDIAANTLGAAVGALVGVLLSRWRQRG